jgi:hypothetical protein
MTTTIIILIYIVSVFVCRHLDYLCYYVRELKEDMFPSIWIIPFVNFIYIIILSYLYISDYVNNRDNKFINWFLYKKKKK